MVVDQKGQPVANAVIVAVPEARLRARVDRYRKTVSDQSGHFTLRGISPGNYTLLAWESVDGDAYYNPDFRTRMKRKAALCDSPKASEKACNCKPSLPQKINSKDHQ